jgi:AraC-like DNA-binding protein
MSDNELSETDIWPKRYNASIVRADATDARPWLKNAPVCAALGHYRIRHTAVATLKAPFKVVRTRLSGSYFMACLTGAGKVLVDGRWQNCSAGHAVLLPPGTLQAFQAIPGKEWHFCWVRYLELPGQRPLATVQTPIIAKYNAASLKLGILGLFSECRTQANPAALEHWAMLVHLYVTQFAQPLELDSRIWHLWQKVAENLAHNWSISEMTQVTHLGEKQLQRLCLEQLGRTPKQHLIWLRMHHAASLLEQSNMKIETIARRVGYENPFVFSTTFKRVMGWTPSAYPARKKVNLKRN